MDAAALNIEQFTQYADLQLNEQIARLSVDWALAFHLSNQQMENIRLRLDALDLQLVRITASDFRATDLGLLSHWNFEIDQIRSDAHSFTEATTQLGRLWNERCQLDHLGFAIESAYSSAFQVIRPLRIEHGTNPEFPDVQLIFGFPTDGSQPTVTVDSQHPRETNARTYARAGSAVVGGIAGHFLGRDAAIAVAGRTAATVGSTIGAALGAGIASGVASLIFSAIDYANRMARLREFETDSADAENQVAHFRARARTLLESRATSICAQWIGSIDSGAATPNFDAFVQAGSRFSARIGALQAQRDQFHSSLSREYIAFINETSERLIGWQEAYWDRLVATFEQLGRAEPAAQRFVMQRLEPAIFSLNRAQNSEANNFFPTRELLLELQLWGVVLTGDLAFRPNRGWSFQDSEPVPIGMRTAWSESINSLRARISPQNLAVHVGGINP